MECSSKLLDCDLQASRFQDVEAPSRGYTVVDVDDQSSTSFNSLDHSNVAMQEGLAERSGKG